MGNAEYMGAMEPHDIHNGMPFSLADYCVDPEILELLHETPNDDSDDEFTQQHVDNTAEQLNATQGSQEHDLMLKRVEFLNTFAYVRKEVERMKQQYTLPFFYPSVTHDADVVMCNTWIKEVQMMRQQLGLPPLSALSLIYVLHMIFIGIA